MVKTSDNSDSHWLLFLMIPFFAGLAAIRRFRAPWAKNIIWAFVVFYGITYTIGKESQEDDINRYVEQLQNLYGKTITLDQAVKDFKASGEADILNPILVNIVSRFTNNQQVLVGIYGLIFGFFFSRNIWYLLERLKGKIKPVTFLLIAAFVLINPFWHINGFRFNTAVHVFLYGLLPFLYEGKRKPLLVSAMSILVHFSFGFPLTILAFYLLFRNKLNLYFGIFIFSIFISGININVFNNFMQTYVPEAFAERSSKYTSDEYVETINEGGVGEGQAAKVWYAKIYLSALYWALKIILVLIFFTERKLIKKQEKLYSLLCFTYLFFGMGNIMSSIPSGGRFLAIAALCATALIIMYYQNLTRPRVYLNQWLLLLTPAIILFIIVAIRTGFYSVGITTIIGNPILAFFTNYNIALNDLIK